MCSFYSSYHHHHDLQIHKRWTLWKQQNKPNEVSCDELWVVVDTVIRSRYSLSKPNVTISAINVHIQQPCVLYLLECWKLLDSYCQIIYSICDIWVALRNRNTCSCWNEQVDIQHDILFHHCPHYKGHSPREHGVLYICKYTQHQLAYEDERALYRHPSLLIQERRAQARAYMTSQHMWQMSLLISRLLLSAREVL